MDVLLVEDNLADAALVRTLLARRPGGSPHALTHVTRVSDAMTSLSEHAFDVVLLDLGLPDGEGSAVVQNLVHHDRGAPVVVLTGAADGSSREMAMAHGALDFVPKDELNAGRLERAMNYAVARTNMADHLRIIVHRSTDAIVVIGANDHRIRFANPAAGLLLGQSPEDMLGDPFDFPVGRGAPTEIKIDVDAIPRAAEMRVAEVDWNGEPAWLATIRDITDRRQAEQLQQRLIHADRLAAIGQLAAGVAHEVNNPAQFILANFDQLDSSILALEAFVADLRRATLSRRGHTAAGPEGVAALLARYRIDEVLSAMKNSAIDNRQGMSRIVEIARDLRVFSRSEQQCLEPTDVNETIRIACKMTANEIRHRASLNVDLEELPRIDGDGSKLCQVFTNLLVNAAQAIDEGSADLNFIRVRSLLEAGTTILVTIEDSGRGIPETTVSRIFEPFFTTKSRDIGTGLGLALTADIVRQHGGDIDVTSQKGRGTTFTIRLP
ncbi:MAG: ATP-binding protein, partial [Myxococcota bacterium]